MTQLSEHYFGDLEAFDEAEVNRDFFKKTYVTPSSVSTKTLSNSKKFIIVGRKGVGKTAIQMHLAEELRERGFLTHHFRFFYDLRSDDYAEISRTQADVSYASVDNSKQLFLHYDFRDVWERVFHRRIGECLIDAGFENAFTALVAPRNTRLSNIFEGITRSLNVKITAPIGPILAEVGIDLSSNTTEISLKQFNKAAREILVKECTEYQLYFFIDELVFSRLNAKEDEITLRAAMVRDIVRTAWDLNRLCATKNVNFHFICSMRPEVRNIINDFDAEAGKYLDGKDVDLSWLAGDGEEGRLILEVMKAKIKHSHYREVDFDAFITQTISFNDRMDTLEEFIVKNTWGRPRDIVRLLNCISKKSPNASRIGEDEIKAALVDYSRSSAKELIDELGVRYGGVILNAMRTGISRQVYDSKGQFWEAISQHLKGESAVGLLEELFYLGFIGGYDPLKGRHYWAHRGNSYLQPNHKVRIHPALWSEFQIQ